MPDERRRLRGRSGQVSSEFALIVGGIALGCLVAVLFLGDGIGGLFGSNARRIGSGAPFRPPVPGNVTFPSTGDDCLHGGWRDYAQYTDQQECLDYIDSLTPTP